MQVSYLPNCYGFPGIHIYIFFNTFKKKNNDDDDNGFTDELCN